MTTSIARATHHRSAPSASPAPILAIILISYFMILLDNSVIFTGLPSIRAGLDLTTTELSWVQDAYALVFGACCCSAPGPATSSAVAGCSSSASRSSAPRPG